MDVLFTCLNYVLLNLEVQVVQIILIWIDQLALVLNKIVVLIKHFFVFMAYIEA